MEGSLLHSHNDVRTYGTHVLYLIHKQYPEGTIEWFKGLNGLRPNITAEI